jgi:hypothetical protein
MVAGNETTGKVTEWQTKSAKDIAVQNAAASLSSPRQAPAQLSVVANQWS